MLERAVAPFSLLRCPSSSFTLRKTAELQEQIERLEVELGATGGITESCGWDDKRRRILLVTKVTTAASPKEAATERMHRERS